MPEWTAFAGFVGVVLAGLLLLARASTGVVDTPDYPTTLTDRVGPTAPTDAPTVRRPATPPTLPSAGMLFANVAVSQGFFATVLIVGAWYASIPASAFGLGGDAVSPASLGVGLGLGVALHAANTVGSRVGERFGLGDSATLRRAMAPDSALGWAVLFAVVLPLVAGFEELLFRGVLVGVFAAGFDVSPWLLAALSSVAFALGHGAQGRVGVTVTGLLGFVLAAAFVLTGSLVTVVVAHYLVNALEFAVNEWA
ncbi:CPBP family intramembrane glutamic endopeptidase [Haloplanus salilacus]|uniref:CPBP family intramembrane glutamic endopeptidase n=1 Tax=Haloplanus salilacus TaxID=2949994 RepID=UPI0030D36173